MAEFCSDLASFLQLQAMKQARPPSSSRCGLPFALWPVRHRGKAGEERHCDPGGRSGNCRGGQGYPVEVLKGLYHHRHSPKSGRISATVTNSPLPLRMPEG
jgi:hypothetical protein